jgi:hypothetical protein
MQHFLKGLSHFPADYALTFSVLDSTRRVAVSAIRLLSNAAVANFRWDCRYPK